MNRTSRTAAAGVLAAAVALGAAAPAAVAAPNASHSKVDHRSAKAHKHVKAHKHTKSPKHVKAEKLSKAERRLLADQRWFARQVDVKVRQLEQVERFGPLKRLDHDARDAVVANIESDIAELEAAKADGLDGTRAALKLLRSDVHEVRPNVYRMVVSDLAWADRLDARLAELAAGDQALAAQVAAARAKLAEAESLLLGYDGDTSRHELHQAVRELCAVAHAVRAVKAAAQETGDPATVA